MIWQNSFLATYKQIVIGIDQSYKNTGISIVADGVIKDIKSVRLEKYDNNSKRREVLRDKLGHLMSVVTEKADHVVCICERARIHGGKRDEKIQGFINLDAIKAMGALTATIVDVCALYGVEVFSVDTRCWKSRVVGTSKPEANKYGVPEEKWPTVRWVISKGHEDKILVDVTGTKKKKGIFERSGKKYQYNDDAADSAGIAMYYVVGDKSKLQLER